MNSYFNTEDSFPDIVYDDFVLMVTGDEITIAYFKTLHKAIQVGVAIKGKKKIYILKIKKAFLWLAGEFLRSNRIEVITSSQLRGRA